MTNVLFITWDGPQTSYMEGLFMPIFAAISKKRNIKFHVLQFSWAEAKKTDLVAARAEALGIEYTSYPVSRKIHPVLGSIYTVWTGRSAIRRYVNDHGIDVIMPRSTFPAIMTSLADCKNLKIVFDADGFPLEERVEFSGLNPEGSQYKFLKAQEIAMVKHADLVLLRSAASREMHASSIPGLNTGKMCVVRNGRDPERFKPLPELREELRKKLGFHAEERVFVYCGSLGPQYELGEMLSIFISYARLKPAKFLILSGDLAYANEQIAEALKDKIVLLKIPFEQVPAYLSTADVAFALRRPTFSMQGVAPIKLGEYLLSGLPTIASMGIGDTTQTLTGFPDCFLYNHQDPERIPAAIHWLQTQSFGSRALIREKALAFCSLDTAADSYIDAFSKLGI